MIESTLEFAQVNPITSTSITTISLLLSYIIYQRCFSPLAHIPGPFLASLTNLWLAHAYWRQDWHRYAIQLHEKYGPMVRVAPGAVDVGDLAAISIIYGVGSKFWKGRWYEHMGNKRSDENIISMFDEAQHKQARRSIDPLYTLKSVRECEYLFHEPIVYFVEQMKKQQGRAIDVTEWMTALAVDAFTAVSYGKAFGLLEFGRATDMLAFAELNWNPYFWAVMIPFMGKVAKLYQGLIITSKVLWSGGKPPLPILGWAGEHINKGLEQDEIPADGHSLLQKSIRLNRENAEVFSEGRLRGHMFEVVFAGFETCGATLPKIIYRIVTTKGCQDRLRKELLQRSNRSSELAGLESYDELLQLPYLSACIHETFRQEPITGIALSRKVPHGGVQMNGYHLPGGTEIGITPWVTSRNKELMPEPELFKPERWLDASKEQRKQMDRADLMFGAGPAGCPGKTMAIALLHKIIAVIFSNFQVTAITPADQIKEINIFPVKWRDVKMKLTPLQKT